MLYIRTDMNNFIATGHVMRCLSIAEAAAEIGEPVTFILADEQALELVSGHGFCAAVLHTKWNDMEGELDALYEVITNKEDAVMLIDSYMATPTYLRKVSGRIKTAYMDDLGIKDASVHALVCYAGYWKKFGHTKRYTNTKLLLGTHYVPLGKQFRAPEKKQIRPYAENILLLSGGTDRFGILEGLIKQLRKETDQNMIVICGPYYEAYDQLRSQYGGHAGIHFHKSVKNMKDYMMQADVAISAAGTTLYELCACGTPTISYSFADNQLDNARYFQEEQLMDYAGDVRDTDIFAKTATLLDEYRSRYGLRKNRSEKMQELVDGQGAIRIAKALLASI
uniref:Pseudaminic acid biosynthesis-associated protein PseG n=1 Tax=Eubacterium plexicaudatum ASF492 TaxID=1235802 RepID=N2B620_9FIRM